MGRVLGRNQLSVLGGTTIGIRNRVYSVSRRILAGHEAGPTRSAVGGVGISVHENHTVLGQFVDVGALVIFRSHVSEISPAEVVDEKEHYVRLGRPIRPEKRSGEQNGEDNESGPMKNHLTRRTRSRVLVKWVETLYPA